MDSAELLQRTRSHYADLDEAVNRFAGRSGLKCPVSCGRCCESPFIEATALECLPLAESLLPKAEEWLLTLNLYIKRNRTLPSPCPFYVTFGFGKGFCSVYEHRPLICRLFGFAAYKTTENEERLDVCHYHGEKKTALPAADPDGTGTAKAPLYKPSKAALAALAPDLSEQKNIAEALYDALNFLLRRPA